MAGQYAFADRMFQTNQGPKFPRAPVHHQRNVARSARDRCSAENPTRPGRAYAQAVTHRQARRTPLIDPGTGTRRARKIRASSHPRCSICSTERRYLALLSAASRPGTVECPRRHRAHSLRPGLRKRRLASANILSDIQSGKLAQRVVGDADRRGTPITRARPTERTVWVASVVNAVGTSQYWNNTAIFITWDDWGGWYDHVAPPHLQLVRARHPRSVDRRVAVRAVRLRLARAARVRQHLEVHRRTFGLGSSDRPTRAPTTSPTASTSRSRRSRFAGSPRSAGRATFSG